jgi:putative ABC transport system permease protein
VPSRTAEAVVWLISVRDLAWRRRRFAIAVAATALVFALALLLSGISASFDNEIRRTTASFAADRWFVAAGTFGPFTAPSAIPADRVRDVRAVPGVTDADAVAIVGATTTTPRRRSVNVVGAIAGGVGPASAGALAAERDAIADASLGLDVGDRLTLNGDVFTVRAVTHGRTFFAGIPTVVVSLRAAQRLGLGGRPLATAVVARGTPSSVPPGFAALTNAEVEADLGRPVAQAKQTISLVRALLWIVAAGIIGAIVYLSALERTTEFAVLKAIGVSTRDIVLGLVSQAVLLAILAVALAVLLERAVAPAAAMSVEVPTLTYVTLPLLALLVGGVASGLALRRALRIDPALAFAG